MRIALAVIFALSALLVPSAAHPCSPIEGVWNVQPSAVPAGQFVLRFSIGSSPSEAFLVGPDDGQYPLEAIPDSWAQYQAVWRTIEDVPPGTYTLMFAECYEDNRWFEGCEDPHVIEVLDEPIGAGPIGDPSFRNVRVDNNPELNSCQDFSIDKLVTIAWDLPAADQPGWFYEVGVPGIDRLRRYFTIGTDPADFDSVFELYEDETREDLCFSVTLRDPNYSVVDTIDFDCVGTPGAGQPGGGGGNTLGCGQGQLSFLPLVLFGGLFGLRRRKSQ